MTSLREDDRLFKVEVSESRAREASAPAGRDKTFRPYDQHQTFLLPPSLDDWLPAGHSARFISETVECALDLSLVYDSYAVATGAPPFDPAMMTKLLLYGYSIGVTSSRGGGGAGPGGRPRGGGGAPTRSPTTARSRAFAGATWAPSRTCSPRCWCCVSARVW
jgi:hypothetical protein